ncbi:MAG: zf-HC2 domain-containing protein [Betaproteobacteria bacterium]|nr:zf-HC2 domain-containing protein [Betaproteobacteria bacterium]
MLNCHDATFLLSQGRDRKLTFSERMRLKLHVGLCSGCCNFERQLPALTRAAQTYGAKTDADEV